MSNEQLELITSRFPQQVNHRAIQPWYDRNVKVVKDRSTHQAIANLDLDLARGPVGVLSVHLHPKDIIFAGAALAASLENLSYALIPYAAFLRTGLNREGLSTPGFAARAAFFRFVIDSLAKVDPESGGPKLDLVPLVRDFERQSPRILKKIEKLGIDPSNQAYWSALDERLLAQAVGSAIFLSGSGGIDIHRETGDLKPALSEGVYGYLYRKFPDNLTCYMVSAIPYGFLLEPVRQHYLWWQTHFVQVSGPFELFPESPASVGRRGLKAVYPDTLQRVECHRDRHLSRFQLDVSRLNPAVVHGK